MSDRQLALQPALDMILPELDVPEHSLVMAAPELYEALKELWEIAGEANIPMVNVKAVRKMGKFVQARIKAEAALAKARGEQEGGQR